MKRNLVFGNEVPSQFKHHQDYIKKIITYFFNELDLDIQLKIVFEPKHKENEFEETDCFLKNKSAENIEMVICDVCLSTIDHDGGVFFYFAMLHEFEHIYDYVRTMQTKLFDFNPCLRFHKSLEAHSSLWASIFGQKLMLIITLLKKNAKRNSPKDFHFQTW